MKIFSTTIIFLIIFLCSFALTHNSNNEFNKKETIYHNKTKDTIINREVVWVDSVYNSLNLRQKIAQLFMVAAYSNKDENHKATIENLITKYNIGGLIFFQGGPVRQAQLTNRFQSKSKTPLFIGIDAEWGLSMRLDSTHRYPWNMTLGAIKDKSLLEKMGKQMATQSKRMGIHFNFAPVVDINTNPKNPIIGNRSFGEDKNLVTESALAVMNGMQSGGIYATAKHFPGHGDTETDSHHTLPIVKFSKERLVNTELYPYKMLIKNGLASVMVAHLSVPSLDNREGYPSSISKNVVTHLLKNDLGFNGLIFTDALNMKGASNFKKPGYIDLEAFLAGNDVLLFPENVPIAIDLFEEAYKNKTISEERLAYSVKKILKYKFNAGLNKYYPITIDKLYEDLNAPEYDALNYELYQNALTVLKNNGNLIPIKELENQKFAYINLGDDNKTFLEYLKNYANVDEISNTNLDNVLPILKDYDKVIIGVHKSDGAWKNHTLSFRELLFIEQISKQNKVILSMFCKPYSLKSIKNYNNIETVIMAYQSNNYTQTLVPQLIFGSFGSTGSLPVSVENYFQFGEGIETKSLQRIGFNAPENSGLNSKILSRIDAIANMAIQKKMMPGAQILVAKSGKVVYHKTFGNHTYYENAKPVNKTDIYDVASLTKILATLPALMQEFDKNHIHLNSTLQEMLPEFKDSNKANATFLDMLTHQAKFQAWIPFYKSTLDSLQRPDVKYYRNRYSEDFPIEVAHHLYLRKDYKDTLVNIIAQSELLSKKQYKYSDLSFILFKEYLERQNQMSLDEITSANFYKKLGMNHTFYNPLKKISLDEIVPSEEDNYFRHQVLQGYVHDMAAAMQGGVSGNAGLFSNALDVAKMMQMFLQKGNYGGNYFFNEDTFNKFNTCYYCDEGNRRGAGFDKPQLGDEGPTCGCVSLTSFGHTGFTGTMAWADPEKDIVYVFLSNRTYPEAKTNRLSKESIRENIQKIIYEAIQ